MTWFKSLTVVKVTTSKRRHKIIVSVTTTLLKIASWLSKLINPNKAQRTNMASTQYNVIIQRNNNIYIYPTGSNGLNYKSNSINLRRGIRWRHIYSKDLNIAFQANIPCAQS